VTIVGDGPDRSAFETAANRLGPNFNDAIRFVGPMPARAGFAVGRILVVPSRAESLPYIVLEAAAAGMPLVATRVGGIPEIFGPDAKDLVPPANPTALAQAIGTALKDAGGLQSRVERLRTRVREHFAAEAMIDAVLAAYTHTLGHREHAEPLARQHG
jgi:glycosyltransferase involved in cell wall biosynthesis